MNSITILVWLRLSSISSNAEMTVRLVKTVLILFFCALVRCQDEEMCIRLPRGLTGPPGPPGPPGENISCTCNETEVKEKLHLQNEAIKKLTEKVEKFSELGRLINLTSTKDNDTSVSININEITEIVNKEWRKRNNCPIGLFDGRIADSSLTSSSQYNNESYYGPQLARLDNQPFGRYIGAWIPQEVSPIPQLSCSQSFYNDYSSTPRIALKDHPHIQMFRCPRGCRNSFSTSSVYGSSTYTDVSRICVAALHDGKITDDGGIVTVKRKPRKVYLGSSRYFMHSSSYTSNRGSFTFLPNILLPWIQVDLQTPTLITGIITQGRPTTKEEWVKTFQIMYGNVTDGLKSMKHENETKIIFQGNTDRTSHVTNMFLEPITARFIRLVVETWQSNVALRMELLSC